MLFWKGEYVSIPQNVLQHTDTSNTELLISKTRYRSIVSFLSLCRFFVKLFSNNLLWWWQVSTNSDFLLSKFGHSMTLLCRSSQKDIIYKNLIEYGKYGCNCRSKESCPLQNKCLTPKIVYRADVKNPGVTETRFYLGATETLLNERFDNHTRDFKHPKYRNSTELSKYVRELKDAHISPVTEWSIATKVLPKTQLNFCKLCVSEKFYIIKSLNDPNLLNKKSELVNNCRHQSEL